MSEAPDLSIEDEVRAAMADINDRDGVTIDNDTGDIVDDKPRDDAGRFAPSVAEEAPAEGADTPAVEEAPVDTANDPYALAPVGAKKAIKDKWASFDAETREALTQREKEVHTEFTRWDEDRNFGKKLKEVVAPYEPFIRSLGADPVTAFDYLIKTDYALRTAAPEAKKQLFIQAAKDYGIDLSGEVQQDGGYQPPVDPRMETLQQRIDRLESERNADIQRTREVEQGQIQQSITEFASRPENVHFERVAPVMASLLQDGQASTLEEAYDMAVYANPDTRALHLAAQRAEEDRKRQADTAAKVAAARSASVSVIGAPGPAVPAISHESSGSLEDDIRAAIAASSGRA